MTQILTVTAKTTMNGEDICMDEQVSINKKMIQNDVISIYSLFTESSGPRWSGE